MLNKGSGLYLYMTYITVTILFGFDKVKKSNGPGYFKINSAESIKDYQSFNDWMKTMSIFDAYKYKHI